MIGLDFKIAKANFFLDPKKILNAVERAKQQRLSRFGRFTQRRAQTSMRRAKGASRPGRPPHAHVGLLRKLLFFAYEKRAATVVIGPVLLRAGSKVPYLMEYGGRTINKGRLGQSRPANYPARPFMQPAFQEELKKVPGIFKDSVRAA